MCIDFVLMKKDQQKFAQGNIDFVLTIKISSRKLRSTNGCLYFLYKRSINYLKVLMVELYFL